MQQQTGTTPGRHLHSGSVCTTAYTLPFLLSPCACSSRLRSHQKPPFWEALRSAPFWTPPPFKPQSITCPTPGPPQCFFLLSRGLDAHSGGFQPHGLCISAASSGTSFLDSACIWPLTIEVLAQSAQCSSNTCPWELFTAPSHLNLYWHSMCFSTWSRYRGLLLPEHKPPESRGRCPLSVTVPFNGARETLNMGGSLATYSFSCYN